MERRGMAAGGATGRLPPPNPNQPHREDCWSDGETAALVHAWGSRYVDCRKLSKTQWQEVTNAVNSLAGAAARPRPPRTDVQCKNRVDTLRKRYKAELALAGPSNWTFYADLDRIVGPTISASASKPLHPSAAWKHPSPSSSPPLPPPPPPPMALPLPNYRPETPADQRPLTEVRIGEEVWLTCLSHALTTETEEVMGLLLGDVESSSTGGSTAVIWGASPQMRCERKKDRVEVNPELLAAASVQAEVMTAAIGKTTRVIGWYHSHPHITVLPSHVDLRTQAMFQLLDSGFVGLIFSCFSENAQKVGKIQVIAFQSLDVTQNTQRAIVPDITNPVIDLESSWSSSDNSLTGIGQDTGDSSASNGSKIWGRPLDVDLHSLLDTNHSARHKPSEDTIVPDEPDNTPRASVDQDGSDMSPSMQQALHRSTMDISGAEYRRKEVPLKVFPTRYLLKLDTTLSSYCDMQRVLFEEEQSAYNQAMLQNICDGKTHPLTSMLHSFTYNASLCKLMEYCWLCSWRRLNYSWPRTKS